MAVGGGAGGGHGGPGGGETGFAIDSVTLTDVYVLDSLSGADGGGIFNAAPLTIDSSVISGNTATSNGGGIYNSAAMTVVDTTIGTMTSNSALTANHGENGGGIFDTGLHTTTIQRSAITGNTATGGGAIAGRSTTIDDIENSTISGNVSQDVAGGIATNGRVMLKNVTLSGNSVVPTSTTESGAGAGLCSFGSGQFTFVNSIISNNTIASTTTVVSNCGRAGGTPDVATFFTSSGYNLEDVDTCALSSTGDIINTDPALGALADNGGKTETMAITASSPALDAGDNANCPNNDQRDSLRPADGDLNGSFVCDIGAFELFVHSADIHINNMTAVDTAYNGDTIQVSIEVHNDVSASTTSTGVEITTATLPAGFTVRSASFTTSTNATPTACAFGTAAVCTVGSLAPGDTATAVIEGTISTTGELTITGNVNSAAPVDPNTVNNSDHVHIQVIGNSDMEITGAIGLGTLSSGVETQIDFTVTNLGTDDATNVRVAAFLPEGLDYQSITISQGTCTYSSDDLSITCNVGNMANGASVNGTVVVKANTTTKYDAVALVGVDADQRDLVPSNDTYQLSVLLGPAVVPPNSGGGCVYNPDGSFDPVLPGILLASLIGVLIYRTRRSSRVTTKH